MFNICLVNENIQKVSRKIFGKPSLPYCFGGHISIWKYLPPVYYLHFNNLRHSKMIILLNISQEISVSINLISFSFSSKVKQFWKITTQHSIENIIAFVRRVNLGLPTHNCLKWTNVLGFFYKISFCPEEIL